MTIEEFLDENTYNLTPDEYNAALDDSQNMDEATWVATYAPLMQEKAVGWNKLDAVKKAKPLPERLREAFGKDGFNPGKTYKDDVYQADFEDVKREDFDKALAKMKEYYDQEVSQKRAEADKIKRQREVKNDWFWRDFLTSDYEKQRYIEDPQSALIGDQAPEWGTAPKTRWGSATDLGLGVAGAAGDVVPGWGSLAGPGIRAVRDVGHRLMDSPYQKDWGDIVKGGIADVMVSGGTIALPNFRKQIRMYNDFMTLPKNVVATKAIETEANNILEGTRKLGQLSGQPLEFRKALAGLPESQMTKELAPLMNSETIDWGAVKEVLKKHANIAYDLKDAEGRASYRLLNEQNDMLNNGMFPTHPKATNLLIPGRGYTPLQKTVLETAEPTAKELKSATRKMLLDKGIAKISNPAANLVVTVPGGRGKGKVNKVETPEEREEIEVIKKREAPFWDMKFKPRKDNSLMYKAWKEYADEHGWEVED